MLLNKGELDGKRLLKPETVERMTRNQIGDLKVAFSGHGDGFGYGFGVVTAAGRGEGGRRPPARSRGAGSTTPISGWIRRSNWSAS